MYVCKQDTFESASTTRHSLAALAETWGINYLQESWSQSHNIIHHSSAVRTAGLDKDVCGFEVT